MQLLLFEPLQSNGANFIKWTNDARMFFNAEDIAKNLISTQNPHPSMRPSPDGCLELIYKSSFDVQNSLPFHHLKQKAINIYQYSTPY